LERRFDNVDRELMRGSRMDHLEKELSKVTESIKSLAADLQSFAHEMKDMGQNFGS
jgi:hypothetical protein